MSERSEGQKAAPPGLSLGAMHFEENAVSRRVANVGRLGDMQRQAAFARETLEIGAKGSHECRPRRLS